MNWHLVPKITGGLCCMTVLAVGILAGTDPILCVTRGLISGALGWVAGALWAYLMAQLYHLGAGQMSPDVMPTRKSSEVDNESEAGRVPSENEKQAA